MRAERLAASELIINPDGSIYHLHLSPGEVADDVIVVGDQDRVRQVSSFFDEIEVEVQNREFVTHTGTYKGKRVTVLSTGIGTDNIDIVLNELDAVVNIDFSSRTIKDHLKALNIVRIGTSGAMQEHIAVDSFVAASHGIGFDGLLHYYETTTDEKLVQIADAFCDATGWNPNHARPYVTAASAQLLQIIGHDMIQGITATAPGFYGPQGRQLRLNTDRNDLNEQVTAFSYGELQVTNFEMETSALYGLGSMLGHHCCTVCAIIANRLTGDFNENYKSTIDKLIETVLDRLTS